MSSIAKKLMMAAGEAKKPQFVIAGHPGGNGIKSYPWDYDTGFGIAYANPSPPQNGTVKSLDVTRSGAVRVAMGHTSSNYFSVYNFSVTGFGAKTGLFSSPPGFTTQVTGVSFNAQGTVLAAAGENLLRVYSVSSFGQLSGGGGISIAGPDAFRDCKISPSGTRLSVSMQRQNSLRVYALSGAALGAQVAQPSVLPNFFTTSNSTDWHPNETGVVFANQSTPNINAYRWSSGSFGTKYSDPSPMEQGLSRFVRFHPSGDYVAVAYQNSVIVYAWTEANGFGARYGVSGSGYHSCAWSVEGDVLFVGQSTSPFIRAIKWNSPGFGTTYSNPATLPNSTVDALVAGEI